MKCFGCSKHINSQKNCSLCENLFCSDSCIEAHKITYHRINKSLIVNSNFMQSNIPPTPEINSKYITKGEIFQKIEYNEIYNLNNFIQIMTKNNRPYIIGSGSYGQVHLCQNIKNNKHYAIKHMDKNRLKKALKTLAGIYTEIDLQSRISHPNIVQLLYVYESKTTFDLVMDYASHGSLFDFIRKNKHLSEELSFSIFIQVVNAVYFLHKNNLIHRDIKPENLLLFENNKVKLCDFGWCVSLNGGQRGTFCGTTEYMAPEMVNLKEYSKEIDVWSLGILLYEMVHGHSPFIPKKPTFNEREVMENIKIHNLKFDKKISEECKELICHLLDENRSKRYKIEDIFNSDFVKKYGRTGSFEEEEKITHSKCVSHIEYFDNVKGKSNLDNEKNIINYNNSDNKKVNNEIIINKTANNFYPKKYNDINIDISKKIEISKEINLHMDNSPDKLKFIPKYKISAKIKNKEGKNEFKLFDKAIEYLNLKEIKQKNNSNIINIDLKEVLKESKHNRNENMKKISEEDDSFKILNSNYSNSEGNNSNTLTIIKKHPVNSGNSMINIIKSNNNDNIKNNSAKNNKITNLIIKNGNIDKAKKKSLISYKSNGEYLISPKNNTPIIIKANNYSNKSNKNNIKKKQKIFIKNNTSNFFNIKKDKSNQSNINKTQMLDMKNNGLLFNENSKIRNYSDINYNSFKNTPDPEFFLPNNNMNKNKYPNISDSKKNNNNMNKTSESNVYQNFNYLIINNSNNIISPSIDQEEKNDKKIINKDNNIILYPYQKMSKTPIKNKVRQKETIKIDKKTIDYENPSKLDNPRKIRVKSKSQIKFMPKKKNINLYLNNNNSQDKIDIITIPKNKNKQNNIIFPKNKKVEYPEILESILNDNTLNMKTINNNYRDFKENSIELNKTIKIHHIKKEKEEIKKLKINNNSFSGGKIIRKLENNNRINSPFKILNYNNKKNSNEQKKDMSVTLSEYSKIIDQREYDVEDNEEDEMQCTPKKTTDKVKIFPYKLISDITKKYK